MKLKTTLLMFIGLFLLATTQPLIAITSSSTIVSSQTIEKQKTELKKGFTTQKVLSKIERLSQRAGIDFSDPIRKWMWYCVFGLAAGLVLWLVGVILIAASPTGGGFGLILTTLGSLVGLAGVICGIVFLVKNNA